jgi:hypothetical protein
MHFQILFFKINSFFYFVNTIYKQTNKTMSSQEVQELQKQRQAQDAEISQSIAAKTQDPSPQNAPQVPVSLEPISESEVKPEDAPVITTSLAQNLHVEDKTPLPTQPSEKLNDTKEPEQDSQTDNQTQHDHQQHQHDHQQHQADHQNQHAQQHQNQHAQQHQNQHSHQADHQSDKKNLLYTADGSIQRVD